MKVKCIKTLETKYKVFNPDEEIDVIKINNDWYVSDAIGISKQQLNEHFIWK